MKIIFFNIVFFVLSIVSSYGQKSGNIKTSQPIVFNTNLKADFSTAEMNMLKEVYGLSLESEILSRPTRVLAMKEILRNRVIIKQISNPKGQKPCPLLSEIPLFDAFVSNIQRDDVFDPVEFNPLKYNFEFHYPGIQRFRVDNTNYFITIKSQFYNN